MKSDARKRAKAPKSEHSVSSRDTTDSPKAADEAKQKLDKSGIYDLQQVKRLLDDEVIAFMEDQGYVEATLVSNIKIIFGSLAVIAALYSHFGPGEFPANKPVVFACVAFYLFCMGLINLSSFIIESSAMFVGYLPQDAKQQPNGRLAKNIWVLTSFEHKGSSVFRVEVRTAPRRKLGAVSTAHPYEKYITHDGRFLAHLFRTDLKKVLTFADTDTKKSN